MRSEDSHNTNKIMAKITFRPKLTCDGCGAEHYELHVVTLITKKRYCSRECLHINYFKFTSLQNHHYEHESKEILA